VLSLRYDLQDQLWASPEGTAYAAVDLSRQETVEFRYLPPTDDLLGPQRLRRYQLARLVNDPSVQRVLALEATASRPYAVLSAAEGEPLVQLAAREAPTLVATARILRGVAQGLMAAHTVGLTHDRLEPATIRWVGSAKRGAGHCLLDCTLSPSDFSSDPAADLAALGRVGRWLQGLSAPEGAPAGPGRDSLAAIWARCEVADPGDRPFASVVVGELDAWLAQHASPTDANRGEVEESAVLLDDLDFGLNSLSGSTLLPNSTEASVAGSSAAGRSTTAAESAEPGTPVRDSPGSDSPGQSSPGGGASSAGSEGGGAGVNKDGDNKGGESDGAGSISGGSCPTFISDAVDMRDDDVDFELDPAAVAERRPEGSPRRASRDPLEGRATLGRYRLLLKLGQGGMGSVWKAEDPVDGRVVALKVLRSDRAGDQLMTRRFHREIRLLAEVGNPHVANVLEVNCEGDLHYFAMEFVDGRDLGGVLKERRRLPEREAVSMATDVARALLEAHRQGVVHRDLKPGNILVCNPDPNGAVPEFPRVKLTDFGLARQVVESESLAVTQAGALMGTPLYFAPEQCSGTGRVDVRADVYSLGATLFHMLAGRPPFEARNVAGLIHKHVSEPAPHLRSLVPALSEAIDGIVDKCLRKNPNERFRDAAELLDEFERLLRGEATSLISHPQIPPADPKQVLAYDFRWELRNPPERLWPHVSNTERLNRAIGLPAVDYTATPDEQGGVRRLAGFQKLGMQIGWQEFPYEWIEGRRLGVFRQFHRGPWSWFTSVVEMTPRPDGGTTLEHHIRLLPANLVGRLAGQVEVGVKSRKALDRVYRRIDEVVSGSLGSLADPFEAVPELAPQASARLEERLQAVIARGGDPLVVERLGEYLAEAPPQELARIRPYALAQKLSLEREQLLSVCLLGTREGLLTMLWDLLCPICRIPSQIKESLRVIGEHGQCEACQSDFELDFANSIELVFRIANDIAPVESGVYCIGGPAHSPHVVAQVRVAPGERFLLDLQLGEGTYRLRGPQLPWRLDFRVVPRASATRWSLALDREPDAGLSRELRPGSQTFELTNQAAYEIVARVERQASRADACTAARAAAHPLFRELFPGECLAPEQLVHVQQVTLLATQLNDADRLFEQLGDAPAFGQLHAHFRAVDEIIRREGGALVKLVGEGIRAVFPEPLLATRAAVALGELSESRLRVAVHRGPALVATINEHLDYFGATVHQSEQLLERAAGLGSTTQPVVLLSEPVASDLAVAMAVRGGGHSLRVVAPSAARVAATTPPVAFQLQSLSTTGSPGPATADPPDKSSPD
jgi:serine/threonine protein kinase/class 3 adenylate cyclase